MRRSCLPALALFGLTTLVLPGCGKGVSQIEGTATLDGQPLADATVTFYPSDKPEHMAATARTDKEGKFVLLRPGGPALAPGKYNVTVRKMVDKKGNVPNEEDYGQLEAAGLLVNRLPRQYGDPAFPKISVEVKSDTKALPPIEVKSKG
jgi:hypothetical protein